MSSFPRASSSLKKLDDHRTLFTYGLVKLDPGIKIPEFIQKYMTSRDLPKMAVNLKKWIRVGRDLEKINSGGSMKIFSAKSFWVWSGALALVIAAGARAQDNCGEPVKTGSGLVRGEPEKDNQTCVWRGIPYAAAPVGELRWKAPQPALKWDGVKETLAFGNRCMQKGMLFNSKGPKAMSEDCLFLNIWRPSPAKRGGKYPVMVWIHGGGYITGGSDEGMVYLGDRLSAAGQVVVVSINYRLNVFGFMASPALRDEDPNHSTGGYGTMDQAFALKWVHDNISNFGGDPGNVTIFGESAGGWSTCTLLASPLAKGLIEQVIIESGGCEASRPPEAAYEVAKKSFLAVGCRFNDLQCMRKIPAQTLLAKGSGAILGGFDYVPVHDGYVLKAMPLEMIKSGDYNRVPVMIGTNLDEFAAAAKLVPKYYYTPPQGYKRTLVKTFAMPDQDAEKLVELYPLKEFNNRPVLAYGRMFATDEALTCPSYRVIMALAQQGGKAYLYRFDYSGMKFEKSMGVFHGAEVPFVFNNLDRGSSAKIFKNKNLEEERGLSKVMQGYWVNFAKTGDPNGSGLPAWAGFKPESQTVQVLDREVRNKPFACREQCEFWKEYPTPYLELTDKVIATLPTYKLATLSERHPKKKHGR